MTTILNIGDKLGMLTVLGSAGCVRDGKSRTRRDLIAVKCDCGNETVVRRNGLISGNARSCGCMRYKTTHGLTKHPLYPCWLSMVRRCTKREHPQFKNYGARGIHVCDRWLDSPQAFIDDMASTYKAGLSIERIDVNGNYEPENCCWADNFEQQRNRRNNFNLTLNGITKKISEWSRIVGLDRSSIKDRINKGWSVERALTEPRRDNAR